MNTAVFSAKEISRHGLRAASAAARSHTIAMDDAEVIRLEKKAGIKSIEVLRGMIWLTGTPAVGDVILQRGDRFTLQAAWPFVLQALEETELSLRAT